MGDDVDHAHDVQDIDVAVLVDVGSLVDKRLRLLLRQVGDDAHDIGDIDVHRAVGIALDARQRRGGHHIADVILLEVGAHHLVIIVVSLARSDVIVGERLGIHVEHHLVDANRITRCAVVHHLIAIDVITHGILHVVVLVVPGEIDLTQARLSSKASRQRAGSLYQHIKA